MAEWVVLELGPMAEGEDPALIRASIRHLVRDAEVFIPASVTQVGEDRVINYLVDGYAFIKRARPDDAYLRLEDTRYVQSVVRHPSSRGRRVALISDADIEKFRRQIRHHTDQNIDVGDTVVVNSGAYKNLTAVVVEDIPEADSVQVRIELRSKDSLITLPRSFLQLMSRAALPSYVIKSRDHRAWYDLVAPVLRWAPKGFADIQALYGEHANLTGWMNRGRTLQAEMRLESADEHLGEMRRLVSRHFTLTKWINHGTGIQSFLRALTQPLDAKPLIDKQVELDRLHRWEREHSEKSAFDRKMDIALPWWDVQRVHDKYKALEAAVFRFLDIERSVRSIERALVGSEMVENIIVDGLNMAVRCSMAPGLSDLRDTKGRPTGAIVGFLNSLTALRKKHPEAEIWVCWDSPSTRRKSVFADYKANRNPLRVTFEVAWLKEVLPFFGVWQAQAEGEEADDVVASLVRGRLAGQRNLIVSNDRDFMQLVTPTTHVLVPAVGVGKEKLCTPEVVQADYGVPPEKMVYLRALGGDTSDNIPGAPGCGLKTSSKLLQLYGSVDGIFLSNLAGLSQSLRDKIRGAETQVRLNLQLMNLVSDLELRLNAPASDQTVAASRLDDIEMNGTRVVSAFFPLSVEVSS